MSKRLVSYRVLFDHRTPVGPEGAYRLRVHAHIQVLYSATERFAIVTCEASVTDDNDHDWLPARSRFLWEDMSEATVILLIARQVEHWKKLVLDAIPAGFLAPAPDVGPAS